MDFKPAMRRSALSTLTELRFKRAVDAPFEGLD